MLRSVGTLSVIILGLVVATLYALRPGPFVAADLAFPILTIIFITSSSVVVTYVAVKAYSRERLLNVLFLGCGAIVFGGTTLLAALLLASEGRNFSATVLAVGAVVSGVFHFLCASVTNLGEPPRPDSGRRASLWLPLASLLVILIVVVAMGNLLPEFYAAGTGTTLLDRVALGVASLTFGTSASMIFLVYWSSRSPVLYWYSLSLAATAVGLAGVIISNGNVSALAMRAGWATMYLGGVLLATSVLSAERLSSLSSGNQGKAV